jgi:DNA invertase Pin-like site-specific DNA recombinase
MASITCGYVHPLKDTGHPGLLRHFPFLDTSRFSRLITLVRCVQNQARQNPNPGQALCRSTATRVSTIDQDPQLQRAALKAAGCDVIRAEKGSGSRRDGRTELQVLLDFVRSDDTLIVTRIDRLARSMKDFQDIVPELKTRKVALPATEQPIDTSTAAGKAFLAMLGIFAEFETNMRRVRQLKGIAAAKEREVYTRRKRQSIQRRFSSCATRRSSVQPPSLNVSTSVYRLLGKAAV